MTTLEETETEAQTEACMKTGDVRVLRDPAGLAVRVRKGSVWITQENEGRDILLQAGDEFVLDRLGKTVIQSLECSRIAVQ